MYENIKIRKFKKREKPRAIVLDDNYTIRTLVDGVLSGRGYEVHGSSEPLSCPIFLDSKCSCSDDTHCTNLIITDINMPYMTGFEFLENQKINGCKVKNIAVMSGRWTDEELQHAKSLGCHVLPQTESNIYSP